MKNVISLKYTWVCVFRQKGYAIGTQEWRGFVCQESMGFPFYLTKILSWFTHLDERQVRI